jgi:site-specific DNA-methyltransferase (adenine-specific)
MRTDVKPYYQDEYVQIFHGDCREILPELPQVDLVLTDPPYGETSLEWDSRVADWLPLLPARNLWCFGSLRFFMQQSFDPWSFAQDIVWEKHNGSIFHADRFRRVHEHVVEFYSGEWSSIYKSPIKTLDATAKVIRRKTRPAHSGHLEDGAYTSRDGGPRLQRSVIRVRSCHGYAQHPTQKPIGIVAPLVEFSCPLQGIVLDPFLGSGTTAVAAKKLNRKCIGIEIEERYCEIAANRCRQMVMELSV